MDKLTELARGLASFITTQILLLNYDKVKVSEETHLSTESVDKLYFDIESFSPLGRAFIEYLKGQKIQEIELKTTSRSGKLIVVVLSEERLVVRINNQVVLNTLKPFSDFPEDFPVDKLTGFNIYNFLTSRECQR